MWVTWFDTVNHNVEVSGAFVSGKGGFYDFFPPVAAIRALDGGGTPTIAVGPVGQVMVSALKMINIFTNRDADIWVAFNADGLNTLANGGFTSSIHLL